MHFLGGGRKYINPKNSSCSIEQQLADCMAQLESFSTRNRIYKVNFFAEVTSSAGFNQLSMKIEKLVAYGLPAPALCCLIAQAPAECEILAEVFYYSEKLWQQEYVTAGNSAGVIFKREGATVFIGQVQAKTSVDCRENSEAAFKDMKNLLALATLPLDSVVRQWNYIENILGHDQGKQRYQEFNNVRSEYYETHFNETGFPAATGIGMEHGGIIIEFAAIDAPGVVSLPVNNPEQVAAHAYSKSVLAGADHLVKLPPKFERARYLELFDRKQIFISGTASIRGEKTEGVGNPEEQTRLTIENIQQLYSDNSLKILSDNTFHPKFGHARIYLKNRQDYSVVRKTFRRSFGNLPVVYLIADICRNDLLVEIEGIFILGQV